MLKHLYISNFTLIDELDITFSSGFSVITGETGAGKSIIIGAVGMLLGNRADVKMIKSGKDKCVVEAIFSISIMIVILLTAFWKTVIWTVTEVNVS